jgi:poly(3-hydroxybutyrate) depolymerase
MPFQLVHKGVVREFEFYPPVGWHYWHERVFTESGRHGLPLVVALHGGAQDPQTFATTWPFPIVANPTSETNWEDRFFVLYPYGFGYYPDTAWEPVRGWNMGFGDDFLPVHSDVSFIQAAIDAVEEMLQRKLDEIGVKRRAIDVDRRFVFGYSMGGMLAYKLAHEVPNYYSALWVMSGTIGGRSHEGLTGTVTNDPQGTSAISLFAHHGEADDVVPPGPREDRTGREQGTHVPDLYDVTGMPAADIAIRKASLQHLAAAVELYKIHNDCEPTAYFNGAGTDGSSTAAEDIGGTATSVKYVFRRSGNPSNPEVIVYRDPTLGHTNFTDPASNRYFDATDVWEFFKQHPRAPA